jgi:hypothetical protein
MRWSQRHFGVNGECAVAYGFSTLVLVALAIRHLCRSEWGAALFQIGFVIISGAGAYLFWLRERYVRGERHRDPPPSRSASG